MPDDQRPEDQTPQQRLSAFTRRNQMDEDDPNAQVIAEMRKNRRANSQRTGSSARHVGPEISFATGRPIDPMFYWKQNNLPWDYWQEEELVKIRDYCRLVYATHPIIGSAIDVYSKYPLTGMEMVCKDDALVEFYETLFFDELNYEEYLIDIGREYWTVGEAWPLGSFNETLGVWEDDELMNPNDIDVHRSPFLKEPRLEMRLPEVIRELIDRRDPPWEYQALMEAYPELKNFVGHEARMPVSNILLKQLKFKADTFHPRGIPILMRGFRAILQEEMLNAAQDSIASRLYTPLILARLGASATDLGTTAPWIPDDGDIAAFEEALDAALAGDFRILTHHFATQMESVFGREQMPRMGDDFDRLTEKQLQVFGLSKTMLSGAGRGETYAADALNRDLVSQLLTTYQRLLQKFFHERALVVAEAQEHYDYEERGGKRYVIMEEVLEVDEETGEQRIVEQPKLLVPELQFKAMTLKSEQDQRQFMEALRGEGVPISMKTRLTNVPIDLDEEIQRTRDEQIQQAVEAQETRKATFEALDAAGLPIPEDLEKDFRPRAVQAQESAEKADEKPTPTIGQDEPADSMGLAPTPDDIASDGEAENVQGKPEPGGGRKVVPLTRNRFRERNRPEESDEMRAGMPRSSMHFRKIIEETETDEETGEKRVTGTREEWYTVDPEDPDQWNKEGPNRLLSGPRHVGLRRFANVDPDTPLEDQGLGPRTEDREDEPQEETG